MAQASSPPYGEGGAAPAGGYPAPRDQLNRGYRRAVPAPPARVGLVRGFPNTYEVQSDTGYPVSTVPAGRWVRHELYRAATPVLNLARNYPMYDPTATGAYNRPGYQ